MRHSVPLPPSDEALERRRVADVRFFEPDKRRLEPDVVFDADRRLALPLPLFTSVVVLTAPKTGMVTNFLYTTGTSRKKYRLSQAYFIQCVRACQSVGVCAFMRHCVDHRHCRHHSYEQWAVAQRAGVWDNDDIGTTKIRTQTCQ